MRAQRGASSGGGKSVFRTDQPVASSAAIMGYGQDPHEVALGAIDKAIGVDDSTTSQRRRAGVGPEPLPRESPGPRQTPSPPRAARSLRSRRCPSPHPLALRGCRGAALRALHGRARPAPTLCVPPLGLPLSCLERSTAIESLTMPADLVV